MTSKRSVIFPVAVALIVRALSEHAYALRNGATAHVYFQKGLFLKEKKIATSLCGGPFREHTKKNAHTLSHSARPNDV